MTCDIPKFSIQCVLLAMNILCWQPPQCILHLATPVSFCIYSKSNYPFFKHNRTNFSVSNSPSFFVYLSRLFSTPFRTCISSDLQSFSPCCHVYHYFFPFLFYCMTIGFSFNTPKNSMLRAIDFICYPNPKFPVIIFLLFSKD